MLATAASEQGRALVSDLGAAATVDHTGDVLAAVRREHADGVDAVVHLAGDPHAPLAALRPGGRFVSTIDQAPAAFAAFTGGTLGKLVITTA